MNKHHVARRPLRWVATVAVALSLGAGLSACTESAINDLSPEDSNVFITNHDRTANFSQYRTFNLPDSVLVESNDRYTQSAQPLEQRVVTRVATELTNRGFTRTAAGQPADLGVIVTRVNNRYTGVAVNPFAGWGGFWGGGFGGGWGIGPGWGGFADPFFFPPYYQYQTTERSWRIDIVDLKNRPVLTPTTDLNDPNNRLRVIYSADIQGGDIFNNNTIDGIISSVFNQSPYLQAAR